MWIESLTIQNIRSIAEARLAFSRGMNILVGPNNAGKSTVLLPLLSLQDGLRRLGREDVRLGSSESSAELALGEPDETILEKKYTKLSFNRRKGRDFEFTGTFEGGSKPEGVPHFPQSEPNNFIYPFVSKRKVTGLSESVNHGTVMKVPSDFENLNAKIDRLANPDFVPAHEIYMRACRDILGFRVTAAHTDQGKRAVYTVRNLQSIPLLAMGEGVMNILGLVVNMALAEHRLFLVEEPENDIHPKALKALLDLVGECAEKNQFVITTHSNIVLKRLGCLPDAKVFHVDYRFEDRLPTTTVRPVDDTLEARRTVLRDLGYELSDSDLWDGWLFFEESSAERIVRQYLIPWFASGLVGRVRTFSAHSIAEVTPKFADFNDLLVFLHLEPSYKNRAWVVVDAGVEEANVVEKLRQTYVAAGWTADKFRQLGQHDFERYYPPPFDEETTRVLAIADKQQRRQEKKTLFDKVMVWIREDEARAKEAFLQSAAEVITLLKEVEEAVTH